MNEAGPRDTRLSAPRSPRAELDRRLTVRLGDRALSEDGAPAIMGVVNITPDSFSDGGRWLEPEAAVAHALELVADGADLLDLGAESTRPGGGVYGVGAEPVPAAREIDRLIPVLRALRKATPAALSIDTRKAEVAEVALSEGADLINDVSALGDSAMAAVVARHGCPIVLMHSRGEIASMQRGIDFADPAAEVTQELLQAARRAMDAGIAPENIILDPGIGFGKTAAQNLTLLRRLDELMEAGFPVLVGASRKSFIATIVDAAPEQRLPGSLAAAAWAAHHGAAILRVHDVSETRQFLEVWRAIDRAGAGA